ncbi:hypothetical protein BIWAKO_02920 [Bosea sp. BIWAKO-01]|nr:hypothetical protein BIWAKO_02920 [Bosea sp. BIWAKO-01]
MIPPRICRGTAFCAVPCKKTHQLTADSRKPPRSLALACSGMASFTAA